MVVTSLQTTRYQGKLLLALLVPARGAIVFCYVLMLVAVLLGVSLVSRRYMDCTRGLVFNHLQVGQGAGSEMARIDRLLLLACFES